MYKTIISKNIRLRHPHLFSVGEGSIVDDFSYFSTQVIIGRFSHIASGCSVAGGKDYKFTLGDYSSVSSGVKIWCGSDNFVEDVVTLIPPNIENVKENFIAGNIIFGNMTAIGANSVVMPNNHIPEGTVIGALSFVPKNFNFEAWSVYVGTPIRKINDRNRDSVLRQVAALEAQIHKIAP